MNDKLDRILALLEQQDDEALYQRFRARLLKEPQVLQLLTVAPRIEIAERVEKITIDGSTPKGRVARLILDGWFDAPKNGNKTLEELNRRGANMLSPRVYEACDALVELGFLYKTKLSNRSNAYAAVAEMKQHVTKS